jgi:hypothetical protein
VESEAERNAVAAVCEVERVQADNSADSTTLRGRPPRVVLSYAHDSDTHREAEPLPDPGRFILAVER